MIPGQLKAEPSVEDDLGRRITLARPATRVIALYGAFNEILFAMDREDVIIARTRADTVPSSIASLPSIGTHMRPNLELIVGLHPDLVLQMGGREESIQSVYDLDRLGITAAYFKVADFEQLFQVIEKLGILTGSEASATSLVKSMHERLERVAMAIPMSDDPPTVFYEVRYPNLLTVGKGSMVTEIIRKAGGTNCMKGNKKLIRVNEEEVLRLSPDVYLVQRGPMNPAPPPLTKRQRLNTLSCVITKRVHVVDEQMFSRPGPRNVDAVEQLAALLYPRKNLNRTTRK